MPLLHPTRWRELEPEFQAYEHLRAAREAIAEANPRVAIEIDNATRYLHPRVLDPVAQREIEDLRAGRTPTDATSSVAGGTAPTGRYSQADLDRAVADALKKRDAAGAGEGGT
jgi:hypothetical protein